MTIENEFVLTPEEIAYLYGGDMKAIVPASAMRLARNVERTVSERRARIHPTPTEAAPTIRDSLMVGGEVRYSAQGPIERYTLDAHIDGMDQTREFVLAKDHDAIVHDLEARCDPAGLVQENGLLRDQTRQLDAMIGRLKREASEAGVVPLALDWTAIQGKIAGYLDEYELRADEGAYTPNERERLILDDAIAGLLAEDDFLALLRAAPPSTPAAALSDMIQTGMGIVKVMHVPADDVRGAPAAEPLVGRARLRELVDVVWNEATESTAVPSTPWADRMIDKVFAAPAAESAEPAKGADVLGALSDLVNALRERYHGRMPEEVQRAYDHAWAIVFTTPGAAVQPTAATADVPRAHMGGREGGKSRLSEALAAATADAQSNCTTCGGSGVVDDGEITESGGVEYENGPVKCIKDCPDCKADAQGDERAAFDVAWALRAYVIGNVEKNSAEGWFKEGWKAALSRQPSAPAAEVPDPAPEVSAKAPEVKPSAPASAGGSRILSLLREARAALEMWKDVAPAVSLCRDIDAALAAAKPEQPDGATAVCMQQGDYLHDDWCALCKGKTRPPGMLTKRQDAAKPEGGSHE